MGTARRYFNRVMSASMKDGVQIKATIVSQSGPAWEQQLLAQHRQKILVSVPKGSPISMLKEKLRDKFISTNLAKLDSIVKSEAFQDANNKIEGITGADIKSLHTIDGYDIDDESSLDDLFGSYTTVVMEVKAEVDLQAKEAEEEDDDCCWGFC